jgi:hypothetical protein
MAARRCCNEDRDACPITKDDTTCPNMTIRN